MTLHFKKEKFDSNEQKNMFSFINKYMQYLISISFYSNIYKEETFNTEKDFFNNIENLIEAKNIKISQDTFKNDPIFVMDTEKLELLCQALYNIVDIFADFSKLESISLTKEEIDFECAESSIANLLL